MDQQQAQQSLDEVRAREHQVMNEAARTGSPWWYVTGLAAVFLAISVGEDLDDRGGTGWPEQAANYAIPVAGLAVICWLAVALHRSTRIRARRYSRKTRTYLAGLLAAFLVVYIGLGTALRAYDIPWDTTLSGAAAALVFLGGALAIPRVAPQDPAARPQRAQ